MMNIEIVKEIRFAVVMYGGVSLAIYINGVAQELLRMVRATAVEDDGARFRVPDKNLKPTETELIYRDLAYLIADKDLIEDKDLLEQYGAWLKNRRRGENPLTVRLRERVTKGENIKVARFVVDILSGSSAGGINGVFMAKVIVGGQSIGALEKLWYSHGDFVKLLNDEESTVDRINKQTIRLGLENQNPPLSLLNSQRMYLKLLTAFDRMDDEESIAEPFVDEVDLFVTMTDYWGIPVPIRLFDQLIHERRHRQNLHFRFRKDDDLNEFVENFYPFLAFSARSTSSFPLAFDPMQLKKANQIIEEVKKQHAAGQAGENLRHDPIPEELWKRSFKPTTVQDAEKGKIAIEWDKRVFVDGGYLDNKPFGYAIAALAQKQSDVLVDRKLIYVEPEPDLDDSHDRATRTAPPLALENTLAALTDMPRYETIREDLQEVLQRNRLITRINQIVTDARKDELDSLRLSFDTLKDIVRQHKNLTDRLIAEYGDATPDVEARTVKWEKLKLGEIAQQKGQIAYPYYRLRVAALTDNLARMVTHRAGYDEDSDYFLAVRDLVYTWRKKKFSRGEERESNVPETNQDAPTPMLFLRDYDFDYRLRRLRFVLQQADRLLQFDGNLRKELEKMKEIAEQLKESRKSARPFTADEKKALQTRFSLVEIEIYDRKTRTPSEIILEHQTEHQDEALRQTVRSFKKAVNDILREFRKDLRQVQPNTVLDPENPNKDSIEMLNRQVSEVAKEIQIVDLEFLLGIAEGQETQINAKNDLEGRRKRAEEFLFDRKEIEDKLNGIGETLKTIYNGDKDFSVFGKSRNQIYQLFNPDAFDSIEQRKVQRRLQIDESEEIYLAVRAYLWHFYDNFDAYDQIIFPVTYETPIGEAAIIDVARISPLDAPSLIDEVKERRSAMLEAADARLSAEEKHKARRKVAGGTFSAFGAFFAEDWRKNAILWGRLDAVERLVSIVLNDNLITKTSELQAEPLRNSLGKARRAIIEELHETILQKSDLIKRTYKKHLEQNPSAEKFDRMVDFVKYKYTVDRNLPEEGVFSTASRSLAVLQKVFREDEFGKLDFSKNVALNGLNLLVKPNLERGARRTFLKPFLPTSYLILGVSVLLLPILILAFAAWLSIGLPPFWFLVGGLVLVAAIYVIGLWSGFRKFNNSWERLKSFLDHMIYSKVTGIERK